MTRPCAAPTPRFAAGAKPRFDSSLSIATDGTSRASNSTVPSVDPSSTTRTSVSCGIDTSTARQQRNVIDAVLNVGMTTERSGMHGYVTAQCSSCDHPRLLFIAEHAAVLAL